MLGARGFRAREAAALVRSKRRLVSDEIRAQRAKMLPDLAPVDEVIAPLTTVTQEDADKLAELKAAEQAVADKAVADKEAAEKAAAEKEAAEKAAAEKATADKEAAEKKAAEKAAAKAAKGAAKDK